MTVRDIRPNPSIPPKIDIRAELGRETGQVVTIHLSSLGSFLFPFVTQIDQFTFANWTKTLFKLLRCFDREFQLLTQVKWQTGPDSGSKVTAFDPGREVTHPLQPVFLEKELKTGPSLPPKAMTFSTNPPGVTLRAGRTVPDSQALVIFNVFLSPS
jgi:hypothetical protein